MVVMLGCDVMCDVACDVMCVMLCVLLKELVRWNERFSAFWVFDL